MTENKTHTSIKLFFKAFAKHLRIIRDDGKDPGQAYRAQILLGQLQQFEKAMYEALETPQNSSFAGDMRELLQVQSFEDMLEWIQNATSPMVPKSLFFCNGKGLWERNFGDDDMPASLKIAHWVQRGFLAELNSSPSQYLIFVFGQPRLILSFVEEENLKREQRLFAGFVGKLASVFLKTAIPQSHRQVQRFPGLIACDDHFLETLSMIERASRRNVSILLEGESGTGKEVVANLIHGRSSRLKKPFVAVNCAAIPAGLIESELFGHEKGSFTGAYNRQIGRVEEANGGTLFLDEIGEMDHAVQAKLLRFLQLHEFHRIGGKQKVTVDVRIVAATNRNLKQRVADGHFRDDLYYRLSVMPFRIPSLRERIADIVPLTYYFLEKYAKKFEMPVPEIDSGVLQVLTSYSFPGNVRELENIVQNMLVVGQGKVIEIHHLPESLQHVDVTQGLGQGEQKQPRQWRETARTCRSFPWKRQSAIPELSRARDFEWEKDIPENNDALKLAKKAIKDFADRHTLELENRFVKHLLERAGGSMPIASELGEINRTLLYKILDRTKSLEN